MSQGTLTTQDAIAPLRTVLDRLVAAFHPEEVWLFGSRAEGRARPGSDWDLLVVLRDGVEPHLLDPVAAWQVVRGLGVPVDVVPCTRSEFDEERLEIDSLPRAAHTPGGRIYVRAS